MDYPQNPTELPRPSLSVMASEVLKWLEDHKDMKILETNRIPALCRIVIEKSGQVTDQDDLRYEELRQSNKDIQEMWYIVKVLGEHLTTKSFKHRFICAAKKDKKLPEKSGQNTEGRDAQFELFIAAVGQHAGFDVENYGESQPDWKMSLDRHTWSVETKRVKSKSKFFRRVNHAKEQIIESTNKGIIFVDISAIGGSKKRRLDSCVSDQQLELERDKRGKALLKNVMRQVKDTIGEAPVGMIIIYDYLIRPEGKKENGEKVPLMFIGWWWAFHLAKTNTREYRECNTFWDQFGSSLPVA